MLHDAYSKVSAQCRHVFGDHRRRRDCQLAVWRRVHGHNGQDHATGRHSDLEHAERFVTAQLGAQRALVIRSWSPDPYVSSL